MAVDKIIIEVSGNTQGVKPVIDDLEKLGAVDKKNAEQFRKTNEEFKRAAAERKKRIDEETQDLAELQQAKKKAFSVEDIKQYNDRITETKNRISTLKGETGKMAGFLKGQFAALGGAIVGAFAVNQLVSFGKEAVTLAAKGEGIRRAFAALNQADLLDNLRAATRNTVSDINLMAAAVKANNFKIPLEDLARYFKFAQQRARETGESVDYLVESIVLGIGRKSPLILDNLGISAVELRSKLKGIGTETATVGQISQAVGQIIDEELSKQGQLLDTTADKLARLDAGWQNFLETAGIALVDFADIASDAFTTVDAGMISVSDAIEAERNRIDANIARGLNESIAAIKARTEAWKAEEAQNVKTVFSLTFLEERLKTLKDELKDLEINSKEYNITMGNMVLVQSMLDKALGKTNEKVKQQKDLFEDFRKDQLDVNADEGDIGFQGDINGELAALKDAADKKKAIMDDLKEYGDKLQDEQYQATIDRLDAEVAAEQEAARRREQIEQALQQAVSQLITMAVDYQLSLSQKAADYELQLLQDKFDAERITQEQYNSQRRAILRDQAQKQKEAAIIKATIDTANAVINAFSEGGPVLAAIAGAVGIAQLAIISATPIPEFEKGGRIGGKRHRDGGTPLIAEKDEFIINRKAASKIGFDNLEMLNRGIVPVKLLKQGISESRDKKMENTLKAVFGSNDFDTYPIEKLLKKSIQNDKQVAQYLVKELKGQTRKRGGY